MDKLEEGAEVTRLPGPQRQPGAPVGPAAVRRAVLDAAEALFVESGVPSVSLREIAAAADVDLALIPRYVGTRAELITLVFDDLSESLARELAERPLAQLSFERDSTLTKWGVVLSYLLESGADLSVTVERVNPVTSLANVFVERFGADPVSARVRAAQVGALSLGWRTFERYFVIAGGLEEIELQALHDEVTAVGRRLGSLPWPLSD